MTMKRLLTTALAVLLCVSLFGCGQTPAPSASSAPAQSATPAESEPEPLPPTNEELALALVEDMSTEELVGQLFFAHMPTTDLVADVTAYQPGGYILFGANIKGQTAESLTATIQSAQDAASVPLLIGVDEEGGTVCRVSRNPNFRAEKFKSPQNLFAEGGLDAVMLDCAEKDTLLQSIGFNVNLGPVCDVSTDPDDFIYDRSFGQSAPETAIFVKQLVDQMQTNHMGSSLKHFPGYGNNVDTHTGIALDMRPLDSFREADFLPFIAGIEAGAGSVMVSHNIMTCVDETYPASLSPAVHTLLREELDFDGVIMTDDLGMDAVKSYVEDGSVAVQAILCGNDMLITSKYQTQIPQVLTAVEEGTIPLETVQQAAIRVLTWKLNLGLIPESSTISGTIGE